MMHRFAIIPLSLSLHFIQAHAEKRLEFFESRIRPVLVENCYECHNSINKASSGLALDYKGGLLKGGERGSVLSFENPQESLLLRAMMHDISNLKMPKGGPKLSPDVIQDFERWISTGAYDPRESRLRQKSSQMKPLGKNLGRKESLGGFSTCSYGATPSASPQNNTHPVDQF